MPALRPENIGPAFRPEIITEAPWVEVKVPKRASPESGRTGYDTMGCKPLAAGKLKVIFIVEQVDVLDAREFFNV